MLLKASLLASLRMGYSWSNFRVERVKIQWLVAAPAKVNFLKISTFSIIVNPLICKKKFLPC